MEMWQLVHIKEVRHWCELINATVCLYMSTIWAYCPWEPRCEYGLSWVISHLFPISPSHSHLIWSSVFSLIKSQKWRKMQKAHEYAFHTGSFKSAKWEFHFPFGLFGTWGSYTCTVLLVSFSRFQVGRSLTRLLWMALFAQRTLHTKR